LPGWSRETMPPTAGRDRSSDGRRTARTGRFSDSGSMSQMSHLFPNAIAFPGILANQSAAGALKLTQGRLVAHFDLSSHLRQS
jgi:hypothetical protein